MALASHRSAVLVGLVVAAECDELHFWIRDVLPKLQSVTPFGEMPGVIVENVR